ncbi:MAG: hypothetical protein IKO63_00225 [Paludibacteraceae bacterium]|nr:hypothetical protein [Paludibacteraceae bacterium]
MSLRSAHKWLIAFLLLATPCVVLAFTPTGVAPAFFGPNALPVPDMSDGLTYDKLRVELAADGYFGHDGSTTADVFARIHVPLFTRWANVSVWMPVCEWYNQADGKGHGAGDVYLSTDIQVLHNAWFKGDNTQFIPQMTIRLGVKTASGEQFARRRHFDSPGYFFDASIGESFPMGPLVLRLAGSAGFLCWQTATARQNDAVMYGLQASLKHEYVSLQTTWGGYVGWERYGDAPMTLKVRASGHIQGFEPYVQYQWGIKDYPFHQLRIGLAYQIDILRSK